MPRTEIDEHAATELHLYIDNTSELYRQKKAILENLTKKIEKAKYDHALAAKLWGYWVEEGAKRYAKEFSVGTDWHQIFTKATRDEVARRVEREEYNELMIQRKAKMNPLSPAATTALVIAGAVAAVGTVIVIATRKSAPTATTTPPIPTPPVPPNQQPAEEKAAPPAETITVETVPTPTLEPGNHYIIGAEPSPVLSQASLTQQGWTIAHQPGDSIHKWPSALPYPPDPTKTANMFAATGQWTGVAIPVPAGVVAVRVLNTPDVIDGVNHGPFEGLTYRSALITIDSSPNGYWIAQATGPGTGSPALGKSRAEVLEKLKYRIDDNTAAASIGGGATPLWWVVSWKSASGDWQPPVYQGYDEQVAHAAAAPFAGRGFETGAWVWDPVSTHWTWQPWESSS